MKALQLRLRRCFRTAIVLVFLLSLVLSLNTNVGAQKLPPIFETGSSDPSAFNAENIRAIKGEYDRRVLGTSDADKEAAKLLRNRLIGIGREQVDAMFNSYIRSDRKKRQLVQFILDVLEIGAATAISLTNGERAKTVISEGLGFLQASRTSLNKNFQLLERQILINKMAADRATILTGILTNRDLDVTQYSWEDARADLRVYRNAGTLDGAMSSLSSDVGKQKVDAEEKLREVKDKPITGAATEVDQTAAKSALDARRDLRKDFADPTTSAAALKTLQTIVAKLLAEDKQIADLLTAKGVSATTTDGNKILDALRDTNTDLTILNRRDLVRKINQITAQVANQQ
jgi:hypothetical protein